MAKDTEEKIEKEVPEEVSKPKTGKVEVDIEMLQSILKEVEGLREIAGKVDRLQKDNEMLVSVADSGRLARWQERNNPKGLVRTARAWLYDGKLVKGTFTVRNDAFVDTLGRIHTDQVLKVIFEDGVEKEIAYDTFSKGKQLIEGDIIKRETDDETGNTYYTLKFPDGKTFQVNYLFLN